MGLYLCFFPNTAGGVVLGIQFAPTEYIVRTGQSSWRACEIPEEISDLIDDQMIGETGA